MNLRILGSTTARILRQLRHDRRTIALLVVVPVLLLTLLYYMFKDIPRVFDSVGLVMLGVFPFVIMFLITSIAMLRERTTGDSRTAAHDPDGQARPALRVRHRVRIAAAIQASVAGGVAYWLFDLDTRQQGLVDPHRDR